MIPIMALYQVNPYIQCIPVGLDTLWNLAGSKVHLEEYV